MQVPSTRPAPRAARGKGARSGGRKKGNKKIWIEEIGEPSASLRAMLEIVQSSDWADWERMLLADSSEPMPLLHAFHVFCTQFLIVELLAPVTAT